MEVQQRLRKCRPWITTIICFLLASSVQCFTTLRKSLNSCKISDRSVSLGFCQNSPSTKIRSSAPTASRNQGPLFGPHPFDLQQHSFHSETRTSLMAWWNPSGIPSAGPSGDAVAVQIEHTSPNSRRIMGDISIPVPLEYVWSILTDYDNLSTHVPNLVESKRVGNRYKEAGAPGDGRYQCRLHQKGAQKIIGFEFGASVTMDMQESMGRNPNEERSIVFKCVDSQFFTEFDGEWKVVSSPDPSYTTVKYVVDVRPKGPVPVAALEWRIKEDVPVNLKAVKKAAMKGASDIQVFSEINSAQSIISAPLQTQGTGITSQKTLSILETVGGHVSNVAAAASAATSRNPRQRTVLTRKADWNEDETTAAYLNDWTRDPSFDWYGDETTGAYLDDMAFSQRV